MNYDYLLGGWFITQCGCVLYCGISVNEELKRLLDRVFIITLVLAALLVITLLSTCWQYGPQLPLWSGEKHRFLMSMIISLPIMVLLCRQYHGITRLRRLLKLPHYTRAYIRFSIETNIMAFAIMLFVAPVTMGIIRPDVCQVHWGGIWFGIGLAFVLGMHTLCIHAMKKQLCQLAKKH